MNNETIIAAWNTVLFEKFTRFRHLLVEGQSAHSDDLDGPDLASGLLQGTGFSAVTFARYDADICNGPDLTEAVEFAMGLGPAGEIARLAGEAGAALRQPVKVALAETLAKYQRDDGVRGPSSTWFVSATRR